MTTKLWIVSAIYVVFVAVPTAVVIGVIGAGMGGGVAAFVGLCGLYATTLLLVMGLIDYAKK